MKKVLVFIMAIYSLIAVQGQQFSFQMFFTDASGHKDTITLGYDSLATDGIDSFLGETNIISMPIDSELDVRITNEWKNRTWFSIHGTYHTKKQIVFYSCPTLAHDHIQTIDVHTNHWPVTATWESSLFSDTCRNGTVFTSVDPGGWWDTGSPSDLKRQILLSNDSVTFSSNTNGGFSKVYGYINGLDTISVFWQTFANESILHTLSSDILVEDNVITVFPNHALSNISMQIPPKFGTINCIQIFSSTGQKVMTTETSNDINISILDKGLYVLLISIKKGEKLRTRMIKE
ncbi:MAG: T9SS type A sorting domain-containing protein [Saprospiraceae bacterium]|nr:T9SS type A sorting domain-containing protein [Saprospiraceae bacterium]HMW38718.1 T9SS type A sorting domain-containing protein [Saprospiraceae bacterium]HMZ40034.1 T9SS type A sorting domain-containing protein [Saprospiraceae bacterium]HNA64424.1 T9SS type A sorting domain-containing protein [Saprospiraceae bacterium]HNB31729.1 T9SS type A sorting domain-containing protein [Saprospiraceae bacterium]